MTSTPLEVAAISAALDGSRMSFQDKGEKGDDDVCYIPSCAEPRYYLRRELMHRTPSPYFIELSSNRVLFEDTFKINRKCFEYLLKLLESELMKSFTKIEKLISPMEKLVICLNYLMSGDSLLNLSDRYEIDVPVLTNIINATCLAIIKNLMRQVMAIPSEEEWKDINSKLEHFWSLPNCIGAIDGRHFVVEAPTEKFNFFPKKTRYMQVMTLVDAEHNFIMVDAGFYCQNGALNGFFSESTLCHYLENNELNIPNGKLLPNSNTKLPYFIYGTKSFPLKTNIMSPYASKKRYSSNSAETNYNITLSVAQSLASEAILMLVHRFQALKRIEAVSSHAINIVLAACVLHNFLRGRNIYKPPENPKVLKPINRGTRTRISKRLRKLFQKRKQNPANLRNILKKYMASTLYSKLA